MAEIMAFDPKRRTSAQAIAVLAALGYLNVEQVILDATYGKGRFWKKWWPNTLYTNDINHEREAEYRFDYRDLSRVWQDEFDVVVFDPPFKLNGTSAHTSDEAYGVAGAYRSLSEIDEDIGAGLAECLRATKPGGLLLYKCQDQVSGGKRRWFSKNCDLYAHDGEEANLVDELYIVGYRKQPDRKCKPCRGLGTQWYPELKVTRIRCDDCGGTGKVECPQKHSRSNVSVLQVFRKGK